MLQSLGSFYFDVHFAMNATLLFLHLTFAFILLVLNYRSRATTGRSRLVAAPLRFQAKNRFLCAFYVIILRPKMQILICGRGL